MNNTAPATFVDAPRTDDFNSVVNLLAVLGEANRKLATLTSVIESGYVALVTPHREDYAALQSTVTETEAALEVIARRNPQWRADKKTITTPFGTIKFTSSTELVAPDESISVQLVLALGGREGAEKYLRTIQVLNKEALEELPAAELAKFGITRKVKENFSVSTAVVDLGKAVKAADRTEKAAAKTAKKAAAAVGA
jgi:hypothetical protein